MVVQVCSNDDATYMMLMVIFKHQFSERVQVQKKMKVAEVAEVCRSYQDKNSPEQMSKRHHDSDDTHLRIWSLAPQYGWV